jgi:hypothetical protein
MHSHRWEEFLREMGLSAVRNRTVWEAHHLVAVAESGYGCDLDNYITLCWRCHKRETRAQHRIWARRRAEARRPLTIARQAVASLIAWRLERVRSAMQPILPLGAEMGQ